MSSSADHDPSARRRFSTRSTKAIWEAVRTAQPRGGAGEEEEEGEREEEEEAALWFFRLGLQTRSSIASMRSSGGTEGSQCANCNASAAVGPLSSLRLLSFALGARSWSVHSRKRSSALIVGTRLIAFDSVVSGSMLTHRCLPPLLPPLPFLPRLMRSSMALRIVVQQDSTRIWLSKVPSHCFPIGEWLYAARSSDRRSTSTLKLEPGILRS